MGTDKRLRIALIAGTLGRAGAEKQLWYMARALRGSGVDVRMYSVTQGEHYEALFCAEGLKPWWFGQSPSSVRRLVALAQELRKFKPHIVQSAHFFTNLYSGLAGRSCGALTIGAMRNDAQYELADNGRWGRLLLRTPAALIANSQAAVEGAVAVGVPASKLQFLANVIDLSEFDLRMGASVPRAEDTAPTVIAIGRLVQAKRFDRFLEAFALARRSVPELRATLVGDGPERANLEQKAATLGLYESLVFQGARDDVPAQLRKADMLALSSEHEGFPNVVLEAMSASLPVVATPAGDAGRIVQEGETGFVVPFENSEAMAERLVHLAKSPALRQQFGTAARKRVEEHYSYGVLSEQLLGLYRKMAQQHHHQNLLRLLPQ